MSNFASSESPCMNRHAMCQCTAVRANETENGHRINGEPTRLQRVNCRDRLQTLDNALCGRFQLRQHVCVPLTHFVEHHPFQTCLLKLFLGESVAPEEIKP